MRMNGIVLPRIISAELKGVTMSCSMVPDSFSRMMAMEVSRRVRIITSTATIPGT